MNGALSWLGFVPEILPPLQGTDADGNTVHTLAWLIFHERNVYARFKSGSMNIKLALEPSHSERWDNQGELQ